MKNSIEKATEKFLNKSVVTDYGSGKIVNVYEASMADADKTPNLMLKLTKALTNGIDVQIVRPKDIKKIEKVYRVKTVRSGRSSTDRENIKEGTLAELISYFGYTLEIGHSWNKSIKRYPTTINSFIKSLQKSYEEKEAACYDRTSVELITNQN